jgi:hypothetical protein
VVDRSNSSRSIARTIMDHNKETKIPENLKSAILEVDTKWPICRYLDNSRRNVAPPMKAKPSFDELLSVLDGWSNFNEIAIDGMNGTGKSTLATSMNNRKYLKINFIAPHVTSGSNYNFDILKSYEYMMLQQSTTCENVCWDRCCYSNLIFYYVHQLMFHYREREIPMDESEVYLFLNNMATSTNLLETITFIESIKHVPIIFIVCKNLKYISISLQNRNSINDIYNSKEYNYQIAQYHVYKYFATILKCPLFDISEIAEYNVTLGDFQQAVRRKVDSKKRKFHDIDGTVESSIRLPDLTASTQLYNDITGISDDFMVYQYSNK